MERAFKAPVRPAGAAGRHARRRRHCRHGPRRPGRRLRRPGRPSTGSRARWPVGSRRSARCRRHLRRRRRGHLDHGRGRQAAAGQREGPSRLRRAEGPDLRGPARQAARGPAAGVGEGGRRLRRVRLVPLGGRHRLARGAGQGAPVQAADEGQGQGQAAPSAKAEPRDRSTGRRAERPVGPRATAGSISAPRTDPTSRRFVGRASTGGVDVVQLREKHLDDRLWSSRAAAGPAGLRRHGVPFILNDRPDLAAAIGADGVHVGQDDILRPRPAGSWATDAIIGLSTHATGELDARPSATSPASRRLPLGRAGGGDADQAGTAGHRPRLRERGGRPGRRGRCGSPVASIPTTVVDLVARRGPPLRGGAVADRGDRPGPRPRVCVGHRRGPRGRAARLSRRSEPLTAGRCQGQPAACPGWSAWRPPWRRRAARPAVTCRPGDGQLDRRRLDGQGRTPRRTSRTRCTTKVPTCPSWVRVNV